jgi:hypothetical protein
MRLQVLCILCLSLSLCLGTDYVLLITLSHRAVACVVHLVNNSIALTKLSR